MCGIAVGTIFIGRLFLVIYVRKGHGGLSKASTIEKGDALTGERDKIENTDLRFERRQVSAAGKGRRT